MWQILVPPENPVVDASEFREILCVWIKEGETPSSFTSINWGLGPREGLAFLWGSVRVCISGAFWRQMLRWWG